MAAGKCLVLVRRAKEEQDGADTVRVGREKGRITQGVRLDRHRDEAPSTLLGLVGGGLWKGHTLLRPQAHDHRLTIADNMEVL